MLGSLSGCVRETKLPSFYPMTRRIVPASSRLFPGWLDVVRTTPVFNPMPFDPDVMSMSVSPVTIDPDGVTPGTCRPDGNDSPAGRWTDSEINVNPGVTIGDEK